MSWSDEDRDLFDVLERGQAGHPRSLQRRVGPSGLGDPCDRSLTYALAGRCPDRVPYAGWKSTIGTAAHAWAEQTVQAENARLGYGRYLTEQRVDVGEVDGRAVWGASDLFDVFRLEVVDWKFVGPGMMRKYRANGVGPAYDVQRHLYGRGFARRGLTPATVAVAFVPRDGELSSAFVDRVPYDEDVAVSALERATNLAVGLRDGGGDPAVVTAGWTACGSAWCDWCPRQPVSMFG